MPQAPRRRPPCARAAQTLVRLPAALGLLMLLGLLLALPATHAGERALELHGHERALRLRPHLDLLADPSDQLRTEQLAAHAAEFRPLSRRHPSGTVLWLRLELRSRAAEPGEWRIEFGLPAAERIELFDAGAAAPRQLGGLGVPLAERSLDHRTPLFAVRLAPGEQRTLYFRVAADQRPNLSARLWDGRDFVRHSHVTTLLLALYFGLLLGLACYNLLVFVALREPSFLLYVLLVSCFAAAMLGFTGLGAQYLWTGGGPLGVRVLPLGLALAGACAVLFAASFLDSRSRSPHWRRLLLGALAVQLALVLAALLLPPPDALRLLAPPALGNLLFLLLFGLRCARRRIAAAGVFSAALLVLLGGAALLELRHLGLLPGHLVSLDVLLVGSALAMLLLSVGLAERLNTLKRQMLEAQAATLATQRQSLLALQGQERILEQRVAERTEALAAANARLQELALRDALTGLANRMALCQHLEHAWLRAERRHEMLALILLDLDGFKPVNDRYGHQAGDQLLAEVARRLQAGARAADLVARLGGDEFVVVCEAMGSAEQAEALAARLLERLAQPFRLSGGEVCIGASIGIGFARPPQGSSDELLRDADAAMYAAKAAGRNGIRLGRCAAPALDAAVQRDES